MSSGCSGIFRATGRRLQRLGRAIVLLVVVGRGLDIEVPGTFLGALEVAQMHLRHLIRPRAQEQAKQWQPKAPARLVVGEGGRVLGALGVEAALEEVGDLLERKRFSFVAGGDRIAFDGPQPLCRIDCDELLLRGEAEDVAQSGEIPLLGDRGEQRLALFFRSRDGLIDGEIAVYLCPVGGQPRQDGSHAKTGIVVDGIHRRLIADDLADESYGGPLSVQPLGAQPIDGAILLDDPQLLFGELAERRLAGRLGLNSWSKNERL